LVFNEGPTKEQAKAAAEEVRKDALAIVSNWHHMQSYKKVIREGKSPDDKKLHILY
jgi:hypothetical protein